MHRLAGAARTSSRSLPALARAGAASRVVGLLATHADWDHLLGPLRVPRARRSACARDDRARGCAPSRAPPSASCATSTTSTTSSARRRSRSAGVAGAAGARAAASSATQRARAAPGRRATPPTAWRSGSPWARRARRAATTSRRSRSRWLSEGGSRDAYLATLDAARAAGRAGGARRARPRRAARRRARARRSCARTADTSRACRTVEAAAGAADRRAEEDPRGERGAGGVDRSRRPTWSSSGPASSAPRWRITRLVTERASCWSTGRGPLRA